MKRIIFLLSICMAYVVADAQIKIGLKFSPHITWAGTDNKKTVSDGSRLNVSYGLMIDNYFTGNYSFSTEITVTTFGTNLSLPAKEFSNIIYQGNAFANSRDLSYNYQFQYINLPFMIKMRTNEIGYLRYYGEFGLGVGYLFRSKADVAFESNELTNVNINAPDDDDKFSIHPVSYSDKVNAMRYSLIIGAGVQYNAFGNTLLIAGLRYDNGLSSFTKDERWNTTLNFISLSAGVLF